MNTILQTLIHRYPDLAACAADIQAAYALLADTYRQGGKVLICGNGGSAADSEHIVGELMKGYLAPRPIPDGFRQQFLAAFPAHGAYLADHLQGALPAISLVSQTSFLTAYANDVAADMVFAQQVFGYGRPGDALLAISTSGQASNVLHALRVARALGLRTIGLTGQDGGAMKDLCDVVIRVPGQRSPEIQERHAAAYHALCALLEEEFFPS